MAHTRTAQPETRAAAVEASRRGWAVFPCRPGDKRPAVDQWERRACADPDTVACFWPSPRHNIGVACGPSNLVVVDLDTVAHGGELPAEWRIAGVAEGADVLAVLAERSGDPRWPATYSVRTPSGGTHLYFLTPEGREIRNSAGKVGPMIDVRAAGGYVVGAGSVTVAGVYEVIDESDPAPLPGWLAELVDPPRLQRPTARPAQTNGGGRPFKVLTGLIQTVLDATPGTDRNSRLYWAACRAFEHAGGGLFEVDAAWAALLDAARRVGLPDGEAEATLSSALTMTRGSR